MHPKNLSNADLEIEIILARKKLERLESVQEARQAVFKDARRRVDARKMERAA